MGNFDQEWRCLHMVPPRLMMERWSVIVQWRVEVKALDVVIN